MTIIHESIYYRNAQRTFWYWWKDGRRQWRRYRRVREC